ncbi:Ig-like domain-containing protein, partial [Patiriisocius marinistellae]|uniref:Ig-like domain-containing protein n=1 Tax=Patiriisocius marinistellae TaxID=2494560 RepID=UPI001AD91E6E
MHKTTLTSKIKKSALALTLSSLLIVATFFLAGLSFSDENFSASIVEENEVILNDDFASNSDLLLTSATNDFSKYNEESSSSSIMTDICYKTGVWTEVSAGVWISQLSQDVKVRVTMEDFSTHWDASGFPESGPLDASCGGFTTNFSGIANQESLKTLVGAQGQNPSKNFTTFNVEFIDNNGASTPVINPKMHWAGIGGSNGNNFNTSKWTLQGGDSATLLSSANSMQLNGQVVELGNAGNYTSQSVNSCGTGEGSGTLQINGSQTVFSFKVQQFNSDGNIDFSNSRDGIDFVFEGCFGSSGTQPVSDWLFSCGDDKLVDEYGYNANGATTTVATLPNPSNIYQYQVEIVYKGGNPGSTIQIRDDSSNTYNLTRSVPFGSGSNVWVYRGQIAGNTSTVTYTNSSQTNRLQSMVVYAFRNVDGAAGSSGVFTNRSGYNDLQTINIQVPLSDGPRDLVVEVPISETTNDGRYLLLRAEAGGITDQTIIYGSDPSLPGGSCCLNIPLLTLSNVPGNVDQVTITVDTRNNQNGQSVGGQSWVIAAGVNVDSLCGENLPVAEDDSYTVFTNSGFSNLNILSNDSFGGDGPNSGAVVITQSPGNGTAIVNKNGTPNNPLDDIIRYEPSNNYTGNDVLKYTITDSNGDTSEATVLILVFNEPNPRDCDCSPFYDNSNFANPQLIAGTNLRVGAVYRFPNVFPGNPYGTTVDALVRVEAFAGGAGLLEMDVTGTGLDRAFQPRINSTNSGDQSVLFSMTFVEGGGNYGDEVTISFFGSPLDIDGDSVISREYAELSLPDAYYLSADAIIDISQGPTFVRGEAQSAANAPGGTVSLDPRFTFSNYWENKSTLLYRIGKLDRNDDRFFSLDLNKATYINPETVVITNPVICGNVSDDQGNPLPNVDIDVTGANGSTQTVTTNADGDYRAIAIIPAIDVEVDFEIRENDPSGYFSVSDIDGANDNLITKTLDIMSTCGNDFVDGTNVELEIGQKTDILCNGDATGSITVNANGGLAPYLYRINGGSQQSDPTFDNLTAGSYNITVTDSLGNTDTLNVLLTEPESISIELTKTNANAIALCNNGTATATVSGGVGPYTYLWDDPNGQTTATATGLSGGILGGTQYTVTITDDNGCTAQQSVIINCVQDCDAVLAVGNVTNVLCNGELTGSASVNASSTANSNATFTFTWNTIPVQIDTGVTSSTINNQGAGVYTVSVTIDGTLCQPVEESVTITEPSSAVSVTVSSTDETGPTTNDGTATANPSGGIPPYTYLWSPGGETTQTITGLSDGVYTVVVTDDNGCSVTNNVTVNNGDCNNLMANTSATPVSCNGGNDGSATVNINGGIGPFTVLWAPGGQTSETISNLIAGVYTVTVTDTATLCTSSSSVTVNQPTALTSGIAITNVNCFGDSTGSLDLTVSGGTAGYTFLWSNGETTEDISGLTAGTYSVVITDENGCVLNDAAVVLQPDAALTAQIDSQLNSLCGAGGSVTVSAQGGTPTYSYSLDGGTQQQSGVFDDLSAGDYVISIFDANLCTVDILVTISLNCTDAIDDINDTFVDLAVSGDVLINDEDAEGDDQAVTSNTQPAN